MTIVPCAICGGTRTRRLYTKSGYDIGRCVRCGLVYANPRAPEEAIRARYSGDYFWKEYLPALGVLDGKYDLSRFDERYAPLLGLLGPPSGRRLLEIGCGAGFFLKSAERRGWSVTGIELSAEASQFARDRLGLDIRREPAEALNVAAARFDAAVMFDTIEHLLDPRAALMSDRAGARSGRTAAHRDPKFPCAQPLPARDRRGPCSVRSSTCITLTNGLLRRLVEDCGFTGVRFIRENPAWTPQETMNFVYTHTPRGLRARVAALDRPRRRPSAGARHPARRPSGHSSVSGESVTHRFLSRYWSC